ncbi:NYN domain-containing protein [Anaerotruncus sp. AF02-27]|uniref:NYN domain-containing protein n=1 Tax=Anaerotruncus TaxID=244127 RepID=UPI000E49E5C1|nr:MULTISPECIES: NYN domain-containing protein [Anaerotruncus]RGX56957.1 NYN domain-containing protein [Anaerotruncus sp. AF02-27]
MASDKKFAVLIDADNISDKYIKIILDEISNDGIATYKRIYGDWTKPALNSWKNVLLDNSITPIQQYGYTVGKNSTDSSLIIDAMDILYTDKVDGFCIVSSDSDFTRLAARLRESAMEVVGMGERKTPKPFIAACNRFKYLDILYETATAQKQPKQKPAAEKPPMKVQPEKPEKVEKAARFKSAEPAEPVRVAPPAKQEEKEMTNLDTIKAAIRTIVTENSDEDDWMFIGTIGNLLVKRYPDFDVRNFGFNKLTPFVESLDMFDIKSVRTHDSSVKLIYVKMK